MSTIIYLDMDGVVVDFEGFVRKHTGKTLNDFRKGEDLWKLLQPYKEDIFLRLEPMPDARVLVNGVFRLAHSYNCAVEVLTAIPKNNAVPNVKRDKRLSLMRYFPDLPSPTFAPYSEHKQFHARPGDILIDDYNRNIEQWIAAGGRGILHKNTKDSLQRLETMLDYTKAYEVK